MFHKYNGNSRRIKPSHSLRLQGVCTTSHRIECLDRFYRRLFSRALPVLSWKFWISRITWIIYNVISKLRVYGNMCLAIVSSSYLVPLLPLSHDVFGDRTLYNFNPFHIHHLLRKFVPLCMGHTVSTLINS